MRHTDDKTTESNRLSDLIGRLIVNHADNADVIEAANALQELSTSDEWIKRLARINYDLMALYLDSAKRVRELEGQINGCADLVENYSYPQTTLINGKYFDALLMLVASEIRGLIVAKPTGERQ